MSLYETRNPMPSIDPRDLDDNAKIIDEFANAATPTAPDRFGVERRTLSGLREDAELLRGDLSDPEGAGLIGIDAETDYPAGTVGDLLQANPLTQNLTVRVPTDYPNLQSALNFCSTKRGAKGFSITVLIEAGHVLSAGYRVDDVDLSHVILSSVDAEVTVSPTFTHIVTYDLQAGVARGNFFSFVHVRSKAPRWNILVNHAAAETDGGYCLYWSQGVVYNLKGVKNADHPTEASGEGGAGFKVGGASHLIAPYAIATNCGIGFALTQATIFDIQFSDASNCRLTGIDVSRGCNGYALSAKVNGCLREGFYIRRSRVIAEAAEIKNCPVGIRTQATSQVSAVNAIFDGTALAVVRGSESVVEITGAMKDGTLLSGQIAALSPQTINALDNAGYTSSSDKVKGNAGQLTAQFTAQATAGGAVSAPPSVYTVLHTITGSSREIMGGTIYGSNIGMRITIDGIVALNITVNQTGSDSAGNAITILSIPPFASKDSFIIEVYNRDASVTKSVGWNVYRRI